MITIVRGRDFFRSLRLYWPNRCQRWEHSSDRSITKPKNQLQKADNSNQLKVEMPNGDLAMKTAKSNLESSSTHSFKSEIFDHQEMSQMPIYNISSLGKTNDLHKLSIGVWNIRVDPAIFALALHWVVHTVVGC